MGELELTRTVVSCERVLEVTLTTTDDRRLVSDRLAFGMDDSSRDILLEDSPVVGFEEVPDGTKVKRDSRRSMTRGGSLHRTAFGERRYIQWPFALWVVR